MKRLIVTKQFAPSAASTINNFQN